jgi:CMP-N,N'-diacetyllegionaminic acid synthase
MINGRSILGITLARCGSKGVLKKNIIDINGKPLLQYTIDEPIDLKLAELMLFDRQI